MVWGLGGGAHLVPDPVQLLQDTLRLLHLPEGPEGLEGAEGPEGPEGAEGAEGPEGPREPRDRGTGESRGSGRPPPGCCVL
jgi:hypothetical protein